MQDDILELKLEEILGAIDEPSVQQLTLYIPNKDKDGRIIKNLEGWIREAQNVLTIIGRGSTTLPPADGTWLKKDVYNIKELKDEYILKEKTTLVYAYIDPDRFEKNFKSLRAFLHRFGRETNQGEVPFEFYGKFYRIREYDSK